MCTSRAGLWLGVPVSKEVLYIMERRGSARSVAYTDSSPGFYLRDEDQKNCSCWDGKDREGYIYIYFSISQLPVSLEKWLWSLSRISGAHHQLSPLVLPATDRAYKQGGSLSEIKTRWPG